MTGSRGHGTYAGAIGHRHRGETLCDACQEASTQYRAWLRFRKGESPVRRCPCGSVFPGHRCHGTPR